MSKTYCTFPWVQATAAANGNMIICCNTYKHEYIRKEDGHPFAVSEIGDTLNYFNSPTLKKVRKEMMEGKQPLACKKCYDVEKDGGVSIRQYSHKITPREELWEATDPTTGELYINKFKHLHLIWGNKCNLMCKMCHPYSSNQLISEFKELKLISDANVEYYEGFWNDDNILDPLKKIAPYLTYLNVSGGEPLVINDFLDYCDYLIANGFSKRISLSFHTNLTVMPKKFFEIWHNFKDVNIKVSLDATDLNYEYIRYPGKWSVVDRNINNLIEITKGKHSNVYLDFHTVFSSFNAHAIPKLIEYIATKTDKFPYFNRVTDSLYSNSQCIPKNAKLKIYQDCIKVIDLYRNHFSKDWAERIETLRAHLDYMMETDLDTGHFYKFVNEQDSLRKIKSKDVVPWFEGAKDDIEDFYIRTLPNSKTNLANLYNPDAVIIQAPAWGVQTVPFNLGALSAYARSRNFKILPIDLNVEFYHRRPEKYKEVWDIDASQWFWGSRDCVETLLESYNDYVDDVVDIVLRTNTKLVGFSCYTSSQYITLKIIEKLKTKNPNLCIIIGGPHAHRYLAGNHFAENPNINAVVQSEGEEALVEIINKVNSSDFNFEDITGLLVKKNGKSFYTGDRELIKPLDLLPFPDFSDFNFQAYLYPYKLPMATSRGCPNKCIFCSEQPYWETYRFRSAVSMVAELEFQQKKYSQITHIDFQDSLINGKVRALTEFAELILEKKIQVKWGGQAVIRKEMTETLMRKLKLAGCEFLAYGLETPNEQLMMHIGKNLSKGSDINKIAKAHTDSGLGVVYNVMFGLPGETEQDAFYVLEFIRRHHKGNIHVNPSAAFCAFSQGTPVSNDPDKYEVDLSKGGYFWSSKDGLNNLLVRLKRFEDFCILVDSLKVRTTYPAKQLHNRNQIIAKYFILHGQPEKAVYYYQEWVKEHPEDSEAQKFLHDNPHLVHVDEDNNVFTPKPYTDPNWVYGVNVHETSMLFSFENRSIEQKLKPNVEVVLGNGEKRTVIKVDINKETDSMVVYLTGNILDGDEVGWPSSIFVEDKIKKIFNIKSI